MDGIDITADPEFVRRAIAFERAWDERMGGDDTLDLRFMLGMLCARITQRGVKPEDLST